MNCHSDLRFLVSVAIATLTGCVTEDVVEPEEAASETSQALAASDRDRVVEPALQEEADLPFPCPVLAPSATFARAMGVGTLKLTWSDNSSTEAGFVVQRSDNGGAWHQIAQMPADTESVIDNLYAGVISFGYRVIAFSAFCVSDPSPLAIVPKAPSHLVGVLVSGATFRLTWRDNSDNETAFFLQHKIGTAPWSDERQIGRNATTVNVILAPGANRYRLRAITANGSSWYSNEVSHTL